MAASYSSSRNWTNSESGTSYTWSSKTYSTREAAGTDGDVSVVDGVAEAATAAVVGGRDVCTCSNVDSAPVLLSSMVAEEEVNVGVVGGGAVHVAAVSNGVSAGSTSPLSVAVVGVG